MANDFEKIKNTHASLFTGIGGFDLAAHWMDWQNVFQCEIEPYCNKVLEKNFPNVKRYTDIRETDFIIHRGRIDVLSGGFPCQPFSVAGKRKGTDDNRYLWHEMLRAISEIKPKVIVGENVAGITSMDNGKTLEKIFADLENQNYEVQSFIIPACSIGAWHKRNRIWIIANSKSEGTRGLQNESSEEGTQDSNIIPGELGGILSDTNSERGCSGEREREYAKDAWQSSTGEIIRRWNAEPNVGRVANGVSKRVDKLRGLGNAIVPQVAYEIFRVIDFCFLKRGRKK